MSDNWVEEYSYKYKPRLWHFSAPVGVALLGWSFVHKSGFVSDWILFGSLCFIAVIMSAWMALAGVIQAALDFHYENTGERWDYKSFQLTAYDRRWRIWAEQIIAGRPMAGRYWYGKGKLFGRTEYEKKMQDLWRRGVLDYTNGTDEKQGYMIRGEAGKKYVQALAHGQKNLPLPPRPTDRNVKYDGDVTAHEAAHEEGEGGGQL